MIMITAQESAVIKSFADPNMSSVVEGVDVSTCDDQNELERLMDILDLNRIEERKIVRARLLNLKAASRSKFGLISFCLIVKIR